MSTLPEGFRRQECADFGLSVAMPEDWQYQYYPALRLNDKQHRFTPQNTTSTSMGLSGFHDLSRSKYTPDEVAEFFLDNLSHTIPTSTIRVEEKGELRAYHQEFVTTRDSSLGIYLGRKVLYVAGIAHEAAQVTYTAFFETPVEDRKQFLEIGHQIVDSVMLSEAPLDETLEA